MEDMLNAESQAACNCSHSEEWAQQGTALQAQWFTGPTVYSGIKSKWASRIVCPHSEQWARQGTALKRSDSQGQLFTVGSKRNRGVPLLFCSHSEEWARQGTALKRSDSLGPLFRVGTRQKGDLDSLFRLSEQPKL